MQRLRMRMLSREGERERGHISWRDGLRRSSGRERETGESEEGVKQVLQSKEIKPPTSLHRLQSRHTRNDFLCCCCCSSSTWFTKIEKSSYSWGGRREGAAAASCNFETVVPASQAGGRCFQVGRGLYCKDKARPQDTGDGPSWRQRWQCALQL